ncbi:MAG: dihydrofolate reductase family protein [Gemmatimonadaceae bacterium]
MTRRIVAFNRVSADGYFSKPDGKLDWTVPEEELDKGAAENMSGQGTIIFGRKTYEMFAAFWPHAADDPKGPEDPHSAGRRSPETKAMARYINDAVKIVFSRTLKDVYWKNSRIIDRFDPRQVEAIKNEPGKDIMIFGSGTIASQLAQNNLIDEYQFVVGPVVLGDGRALISGVSKTLRLDLLEAKPYKNGNVMLRYAARK